MRATKTVRHLALGMSYGLVIEWVYVDWTPMHSWTSAPVLDFLLMGALWLGAALAVFKARQIARPSLTAATTFGLVGTLMFTVRMLWIGTYATPFTVLPLAGALLSYIIELGILARNPA